MGGGLEQVDLVTQNQSAEEPDKAAQYQGNSTV